jgi:hypothetical protein
VADDVFTNEDMELLSDQEAAPFRILAGALLQNFVRLRSLIGINAPANHQGKIRSGDRLDSLNLDCVTPE